VGCVYRHYRTERPPIYEGLRGTGRRAGPLRNRVRGPRPFRSASPPGCGR